MSDISNTYGTISPANTRDIRQTAARWAQQGYIVHPCNGKAPVHRDWQVATMPPAYSDIVRWTSDCNLGILTGSRNKNLVVIDFDDLTYYHEFCQRFPRLVDTMTVTTNRGMHVYLHVADLPLTTKAPGQVELLADTRTGGGFNVIMPPSVHPDTGHLYFSNHKAILNVDSIADVVAWLAQEICPPKETSRSPERPRPNPRQQTSGRFNDRARDAYMIALIDNKASDIQSAPVGTRNNTLYETGLVVFAHCANCQYDIMQAWRILHDAALASGLKADEIDATLSSALKAADPSRVNTPDFAYPTAPASDTGANRASGHPQSFQKRADAPSGDDLHQRGPMASKKPIKDRIKPVTLPPFTADETVNLRYISDMDLTMLTGYTGICIKSPIDTGKTTLGKRLIEDTEKRLKTAPRVLVITHRQALVENIAADYGIKSYKDFQADDRSLIKAAPEMAITYDSLPRLGWKGNYPPYDLVIIDEIDQFLQHLDAGTMRGGHPKAANTALKVICEQAGQLITLSAHNDDIAAKWVCQRKGKYSTVCIENTYRFDRGELHLHSSEASAVGQAVRLLYQDNGPVVIPSLKKKGAVIDQYFQTRFPKKTGYLVNSDNSESRNVQAFLAEVNDRLLELDYLGYSPSWGTGVNIPVPVAGVIGSFANQPLTAADILQAMGRCRNAGERHVYIQAAEGNRETDWELLYAIGYQNALTSADYAHFADHDIQPFDIALKGIHKLLSMYQAQRNSMLNDPLSYFVALAEDMGYQIVFHDHDAKGIRAGLKAARDKLKEEQKDRTLTNEPVTADELEAIRRDPNQDITPEIRAGHARWKMEHLTGLTINPQVYDDLYTSERRQRVRRLADLLEDMEYLRDADRREAAEGSLLSQRKHLYATAQLIDAIVRYVFGCTVDRLPDVFIDMTRSDIEERMRDCLAMFGSDLKLLLGWRPDHHTHEPLNVLRWVLSKIGAKVRYRQVMEDGERFYLYSLDCDRWGRFLTYAQGHLAQRERDRQARLLKPGNKGTYPNLSNPPDQGAMGAKTPPEAPIPLLM